MSGQKKLPTPYKTKRFRETIQNRRRGRGFKIQQYREIREMEKEIYISDGIGGEHRVKYLDENRVIVQTVSRYVDSDYVSYSMPCKVLLHQLASFPYTEELKLQIKEYHAQFPDE